MGMFDDLRCEYPLPDLEDPTSIRFQTKDTDAQYLEKYTINKAGRLIHRRPGGYEDRSDPKAEGLMKLAGCMTAVNHEDVDTNYHGWLRFYGDRKIPADHEHIFPRVGNEWQGCHCGIKRGEDMEWFEYNARFTDGTIDKIERVISEAGA